MPRSLTLRSPCAAGCRARGRVAAQGALAAWAARRGLPAGSAHPGGQLRPRRGGRPSARCGVRRCRHLLRRPAPAAGVLAVQRRVPHEKESGAPASRAGPRTRAQHARQISRSGARAHPPGALATLVGQGRAWKAKCPQGWIAEGGVRRCSPPAAYSGPCRLDVCSAAVATSHCGGRPDDARGWQLPGATLISLASTTQCLSIGRPNAALFGDALLHRRTAALPYSSGAAHRSASGSLISSSLTKGDPGPRPVPRRGHPSCAVAAPGVLGWDGAPRVMWPSGADAFAIPTGPRRALRSSLREHRVGTAASA